MQHHHLPRSLALAAALMLSAGLSWAQASKIPDAVVDPSLFPSDAAMGEAMQRARSAVQGNGQDQLDRAAARSNRARQIGAQGPTGQPATSQMPEVLQGGNSSRGIDVSTLIDQYKNGESPFAGQEKPMKVLAFVSLSMPTGSLERLGRDLKKVGGVAIVRGMKFGVDPGKWDASLKALEPLAKTGVEIQISPGLFQLFQVSAVPLVVVAPEGVSERGCSEGTCAGGNYATIAGDVTLDYAFDTLRSRNDQIGALARHYLKQFE